MLTPTEADTEAQKLYTAWLAQPDAEKAIYLPPNLQTAWAQFKATENSNDWRSKALRLIARSHWILMELWNVLNNYSQLGLCPIHNVMDDDWKQIRIALVQRYITVQLLEG